MSLNLGTPAVEAAKHLHGNEHFQAVRDGLREQLRARMNLAIDSAPDHCVANTAYVRALRDVWVAIESAATGVQQKQVKTPGPEKV